MLVAPPRDSPRDNWHTTSGDDLGHRARPRAIRVTRKGGTLAQVPSPCGPMRRSPGTSQARGRRRARLPGCPTPSIAEPTRPDRITHQEPWQIIPPVVQTLEAEDVAANAACHRLEPGSTSTAKRSPAPAFGKARPMKNRIEFPAVAGLAMNGTSATFTEPGVTRSPFAIDAAAHASTALLAPLPQRRPERRDSLSRNQDRRAIGGAACGHPSAAHSSSQATIGSGKPCSSIAVRGPKVKFLPIARSATAPAITIRAGLA